MKEKLLPFHVSGEFARHASGQALSMQPFGKINASAKGRFDRAQVRFKITEREARNLAEYCDVLVGAGDKVAKTVLKNAKRAIEMFEEQKPAPLIELPIVKSAETLAKHQAQNNLFWHHPVLPDGTHPL